MTTSQIVSAAGLIFLVLGWIAVLLFIHRNQTRHRRTMKKLIRANMLAETARIYAHAGMPEEAKDALVEAWRLIGEVEGER